MINPVSVPLGIDRAKPRVFRIAVRGADLSGAVMHAQIRLTPDAAGDPLLDLPTITDLGTIPGIRLVALDKSGDAPVSTIDVQIPGTIDWPAAPELGGAWTGAWDLFVALGGGSLMEKWISGPVIVSPTVTKGAPPGLVALPATAPSNAVVTLTAAALTATLGADLQPAYDRIAALAKATGDHAGVTDDAIATLRTHADAVDTHLGAIDTHLSTLDEGVTATEATIAAYGATSIPFPRGAHKAWRLRCTAYNGANTAELGEMALRSIPGGANLARGGTPFGSVGEGGNPYFAATAAFDRNPGSLWIGGRTSMAAQLVLGYIAAKPISVTEVALTAQSASGYAAPQAAAFEYSDDTTDGFDGTWTTAWAMSGQTKWAGGETRSFTDPLYGQPVRKVALIDPDTGRLYASIAGQDVEVSVATAVTADPLVPVIQRRRLKAALYYGAPPTPMTADPITISVAATSQMEGGTAYAATDPLVRLLGGAPYALDPYNNVETPQYVLYQVGGTKQGNSSITEVLLPASVTQVEWYTLDKGANAPISIMLDGVLTNTAGYALPGVGGSGVQQHVTINLPASTGKPRRLRILATSRPEGGFVLPAGAPALLDPTPAFMRSIYYEGDSITEGAVADKLAAYWAMQASFRLGIDNPIVGGVGSSGYISRRPLGNNQFGTVLLERLPSVLTANQGSPPDGLVAASGINDSAQTAADVQAAALAYFQAARAAAPDMVIVAFGPWSGPGGYAADGSGNLARTRDAIFEAAAKVQRIDTVDVTGWVTADNTPGFFNTNADGVYLDGPHPNDAGHAFYGQQAATALARIFERY